MYADVPIHIRIIGKGNISRPRVVVEGTIGWIKQAWTLLDDAEENTDLFLQGKIFAIGAAPMNFLCRRRGRFLRDMNWARGARSAWEIGVDYDDIMNKTDSCTFKACESVLFMISS